MGGVGLEACDDAFYNEGFWNDTDAQMVYHEGGMYFIRNDGKLYRYDFAEDEITERELLWLKSAEGGA